MSHKGHEIVYTVGMCSAESRCEITPSGDVRLIGEFRLTDIDGDPIIYCGTCDREIHFGDENLSENWEVVL